MSNDNLEAKKVVNSNPSFLLVDSEKNTDLKNNWTVEQSAELYGIKFWGKPYFGINALGHIEVTASGDAAKAELPKSIDLYNLVMDLKARGVRFPMLIRFPDLIKARIDLLTTCFENSIKDYNYKGKYAGVYPVKVNQQRHLVEEIAKFGKKKRLGLEAGSKPELLVALALLDNPSALVICNGYKDAEYIETAMLSQKLGRQTLIVVDRQDELEMIIEASRKLNIKPRIGFRVKLNTQSSGRWVESSGARSKFGLTPAEIVAGIEELKKVDMLSCLELLHFHIGSQIPGIQHIKSAVKEGTRFFTEICKMGANLKFFDVGGGLGVDYDGTGRGDSSTNYSEQEYANDVVSIIQSICDEKNVPHPTIVTESGRSIVAHSSILVFDVIGQNEVAQRKLNIDISEKDSRLVHDLHDLFREVNQTNLNEFYNDLVERKRDTHNMFSYGVLSLDQLAKAEEIYWATAAKMHRLARTNPDAEELFWELEKLQSDTYYCNFSVFQSLPDLWAVGQRFPVMPIHRLGEAPLRRAVLVDLTCDSDGKIDEFNDFDTDQPQKYLEVHSVDKGQDYLLGVFLTGAYQETLGDLHNLFGDTDAVHITITSTGYVVDQVVQGQSVKDVLQYVQYDKSQLIERIRKTSETAIHKGQLSHEEARLLMDHYIAGLSSYTYLQMNKGNPAKAQLGQGPLVNGSIPLDDRMS